MSRRALVTVPGLNMAIIASKPEKTQAPSDRDRFDGKGT